MSALPIRRRPRLAPAGRGSIGLGLVALGLLSAACAAARPPAPDPAAAPGARGPAASSATSPAARVDSLFAEWAAPDGPGAAVAVLKDGVVVLERGYGSAQLEHGVPITPATVFHVASVTKQFTAFAVALLAERGVLSLDDDIRAHIPELPDLGHRVTLRQLIHHTSGIRDQWELLAMSGWRLDDVITTDHILGLARRQRALNFEPGTEHLYSNMGYTLLAQVVARAGGRPFPEWMRENVFEPLGMTSTHIHDDHRMVVPRRAYSYAPVPDRDEDRDGDDDGPAWRNAVLSYANAGATSLFTTAGDLARWLRNFETAEVGGPAVVERMRERAVLASGDTLGYAFAIVRGEHRGRATWSHGGADAGFRSYVLHVPEERLGVVVLSNAATINPGALAHRVFDVYLDAATPEGRPVADDVAPRDRDDAPEPAPQPDSEADAEAAPVAVPRALLDAYAGRWNIRGPGPVRFQRQGEMLAIVVDGRSRPMLARSDSTFEFDGALIRFVREGERIDSLVVRAGGREHPGTRVPDRPLTPAEMEAYEGVYYSPEVDALYRVARREDALVLQHVRHGEIPLERTEEDTFTGGRWPFTRLEFRRDREGGVQAFLLTGGRVRNLEFVRLAAGALPDAGRRP